ncbi:MAG TPA: hypothetical protein VM597_33820, partial [Gemmataceae bacterium]|nr:hypothetical protein [Gemmataceae bacterium]
MRLIPLLLLTLPALAQEPKVPPGLEMRRVGPSPAPTPDGKLPDGVRLRLGTDKFRETSRIQAAALSPDGKRIAVYSSGQTIRILDVATGAELRRFPLREALRSPQVLFTPDGKQLLTTGYNGVNVWDAETGRLSFSINSAARDWDGALHLSADGKTAVVGFEYQKGGVKVLDLPGNAVRTTITPAHGANVRGIPSPDGRLVAVYGMPDRRQRPSAVGRAVQLFDAATGAAKAILETDADYVYSVAFSSDGARLATAGPGVIQLWDVATAKTIVRIDGRPGQGANLTFSPDGKLLSASGPVGLFETWETATGKRTASCTGPVPVLSGLRYRPDGQLLAWASRSNALDIWEVPSGKRLSPGGGHTAAVTGLHFGPDGKTLFSTSDGETLRWDVATGTELGPFELAGRDGPRPVGRTNGPVLFSPDGKYVIAMDAADHRPVAWDVAAGTEAFPLHAPGGVAFVTRNDFFTFAADSSRLAVIPRSGSNDAPTPMTVWNLAAGRSVTTLAGQPGNYTAAAFSTDGSILATAVHRYGREPAPEIWAWDLATGQTLSKRILPVGNFIASPVVFLDERLYVPFLATVQAQKVYDGLTGVEVRALEGFVSAAPGGAALSPDGRLLAVAIQSYSIPPGSAPGGLMVRVYETATGTARHDLAGPAGLATSVAFSRDGKTLAVGCTDTTILLWDLAGPPEKVEPLSPSVLNELWGALDGSVAKRAEQAMRKLVARPAESVPYLAGLVKPAPPPEATPELLAKLIADLDAPRFAVREAASRKLERLGNPARAAVVEALKRTDLAAEVRERLEKAKVVLDQPVNLDPWVRSLRAIEVLERVGSAEAVAHLKALAGGRDVPSTRAAR